MAASSDQIVALSINEDSFEPVIAIGYRTVRNCPSLSYHITALSEDHDSEHNFLHSPVYIGLIPHIVMRYDAAIPSKTIIKECITKHFPELEIWDCNCDIKLNETEKFVFPEVFGVELVSVNLVLIL